MKSATNVADGTNAAIIRTIVLERGPICASLTILATLFLAAGVQAGPKEDAQARAALELSIALQKAAVKDRVTVRPDYATAYALAMRDGKPLLIHVGAFDCSDVCRDADCRTCSTDEVFGDKTPRLILAKPDGGKLLFVREWRTAPKSAAVKDAVAACCATGR